jgi:predicted AlkP superfamily pyrophosphatase or phosphodiesterase
MLKTPILFIIFNRLDTAQKVFERIKQAKPKQLFIAGDGPRADKIDDTEKCQATRKILDNIQLII